MIRKWDSGEWLVRGVMEEHVEPVEAFHVEWEALEVEHHVDPMLRCLEKDPCSRNWGTLGRRFLDLDHDGMSPTGLLWSEADNKKRSDLHGSGG